MDPTITAIFEDGVLKPTTPLDLPPNAVVRITIESPEDSPEDRDRAWREFERSWDEIAVDFSRNRPTRDELHERT